MGPLPNLHAANLYLLPMILSYYFLILCPPLAALDQVGQPSGPTLPVPSHTGSCVFPSCTILRRGVSPFLHTLQTKALLFLLLPPGPKPRTPKSPASIYPAKLVSVDILITSQNKLG